MGQKSSKPFVVEVYAQWVLKYPLLAQKGMLISGATETELSDVDVSIFVSFELHLCALRPDHAELFKFEKNTHVQ